MSVVDDYKNQFSWRAWPVLFAALPPLDGRTVLDLGCGVGDQAAELVARGARVIGVDGNEEVVRAARSRGLANAEFHVGDLRALPEFGAVDGIWASFAAAYFTDLQPVLATWTKPLRPGGWIALTEIDDLFGHEPLRPRTKSLLDSYAKDALLAGRYDFAMGRKLRGHLEGSGFTVSSELTPPDLEFAFDGKARADVVEGWRRRFETMRLLRRHCGAEFESVRDDFLACLTRTDHRSVATVRFCLASR